MPEFNKPLQGVDTRFSPVRSTGGGDGGKAAAVAQGLSAVVEGVSVFGKASASEAGRAAGVAQSGEGLALEQVNTDVDQINKSIAEGLDLKAEEVGGVLTQRQVQESKDKSLRSLSLTDRHIQGLIDAGSISSAEGNARRRVALTERINEGSNFLFKDEFINAMASTTGGSSGSASRAFFGKTASELKAEAIAEAQTKALVAREEAITGLQMSTNTDRETTEREYDKQLEGQRKIAELEVKKANQTISADENAQYYDQVQINTTRTLETNLRQNLVNGVLPDENVGSLKQTAMDQANSMRLALANDNSLSVKGRKEQNADIDLWESGITARIDSLTKAKHSKEVLTALETTAKVVGYEAFPELAIIGTINKELAAEIAKQPAGSIQSWIKARTNERQSTTLADGVKAMAQLVSGKEVKNPGDLTGMLGTPTAMNDSADPASPNKATWKAAYAQAPSSSFVSLRAPFAIKAANWDKDENVRNKIIEHYNFSVDGIAKKADYMGVGMPQIVLVPTNENRANISSFAKSQFKTTMDIPPELAQYPDTVSIIEQGYKTFKEQPWLWNQRFDTAVAGYNEYLRGDYVLNNGLEQEGPAQEETPPVKKQEVEENAPLSVKNNNPGNLRSFGDTPTVDTPSGKFAKFETPEQGVRALARDLDTKIARGNNSIEEILRQYSPDTGEHNLKRGSKVEDYIKFAEKKTGIPRDKVLSTDADRAKLMKAIIAFESGNKSNITDEQIKQGIIDAEAR